MTKKSISRLNRDSERDGIIKSLQAAVVTLHMRVKELEQFKADVMKTVMSSTKGQEVTAHD